MLFGEDSTESVSPVSPQVSDAQVAQLRARLDGTGLSSMQDRQQLIEQLAGRPIASLRDLTSGEARVLLIRLPASASAVQSQRGSAWDQRDGDTWIDRL